MPGVIKAGHPHEVADNCQAVAFNFEDICDKASRYLDTVRRQAAKILTDAKQQAKEIEVRAQEQGRQAAQREAEQALQSKMEQRLQTLLPALEKAVSGLRESEQTWLNQWERQTVHLACAIAERVVRRELSRTLEITLAWIREALELAMGSSRLRLHLNPQDHQALGDQLPAVLARLHQLAPTEIVADPEISPGGCRVVTEFGCVDQQLEAQLARIEEELS